MARTGSKRTNRSALVVGVAGIMGAGKSTVARVFEDLGAKRVDADVLGKDLLKDRSVKKAVVEAFGKAVTTRRGEIDTTRLGEIAFADRRSARKLDELTREALIRRIRARIDELGEAADVIVVDAALLPEWDSKNWIDVLLVVDSDEKTAVERSCCDSKFEEANVIARMRCQFSRKEKTREADVIVPNYGSLDELKARAKKVFWTLLSVSGKE